MSNMGIVQQKPSTIQVRSTPREFLVSSGSGTLGIMWTEESLLDTEWVGERSVSVSPNIYSWTKLFQFRQIQFKTNPMQENCSFSLKDPLPFKLSPKNWFLKPPRGQPLIPSLEVEWGRNDQLLGSDLLIHLRDTTLHSLDCLLPSRALSLPGTEWPGDIAERIGHYAY